MKQEKRVRGIKAGMEMFNKKLEGVDTTTEGIEEILLNKTMECNKEIQEKSAKNVQTRSPEYWEWVRQGVMQGYYFNLGYLRGASATRLRFMQEIEKQKQESE